MIKRYDVQYLPRGAQRAVKPGAVFSPDALPDAWAALAAAPICERPWDTGNDYAPEAAARMGWNEEGLHLLLYAKEAVARAEHTAHGAMVCEDSCLEAFVGLCGEDARYLNAEFNRRGVMLLGCGTGRTPPRKRWYSPPAGMRILASAHAGGWWAVQALLPAALLQAELGLPMVRGMAFRGNFYKCGDLTAFPHYQTWSPIAWEKPDFHRPEQFGVLSLA